MKLLHLNIENKIPVSWKSKILKHYKRNTLLGQHRLQKKNLKFFK